MNSINENRDSLTKYMHFLHAPQYYVIIRTTKYVILKRFIIILMFLQCRQRIGGC